jgi:hypothetical protein
MAVKKISKKEISNQASSLGKLGGRPPKASPKIK